MKKILRAGDKIRLRVPLLSGYCGIGIVAETQMHPDEGVVFQIPGRDGLCDACRHEVGLCRDNDEFRGLDGQERIVKKNRRLINKIVKEIESGRKN